MTKNIHELKLNTAYFPSVADGSKTFEIRKNDRGYEVGDVLILREYDDAENYTGKRLVVDVTYVTDYQQRDGYVVMSIALI